MADLVATAEPLALNSGSPNVATLSIGGQPLAQAIVTAIHSTDWQGRQLLYATPRTNLALQSVDATKWSTWNAGGAATITRTAAQASPDGNANATLVSVTGLPSGGPVAGVIQPVAGTVPAAQSATYVVFLKAASSACVVKVSLDGAAFNSAGVFAYAYFDLVAGSVAPNGATAASILPIDDGYYVCTISGVSAKAGAIVVDVFASTPGSSAFEVFGGEFYASNVAGAYIPTTTAPVTVTDYTQSGAQITFGQNPATGATQDWDGSGILPGQNWSWPLTLPQTPFGNDAPTYTPVDNILRSKMQGGVDKARPLFTATSAMIPITLMLTQAQRDTLVDGFFKTMLGYTQPFDWTDFRTGLPATYRYGGTALPTEKYVGQDGDVIWWQVQFDLELLP